MMKYIKPIEPLTREFVGREREIRSLKSSLARPELCNVILLGDAGSGKTALVQGLMANDVNRVYYEVELVSMINDIASSDELALKLKELFDEVSDHVLTTKQEIVLFIDEFHQIVQLSSAAVEVLKPLLAKSGTKGVRVITATTYAEFQEYIAPNLPLLERLHRINLSQADEHMTTLILQDMAKRYDVEIKDESLYHSIYEVTNKYVPASSQPRKSLTLLDAMIGTYRAFGTPVDKELLSSLMFDMYNVNITFRADVSQIEDDINKVVLSQKLAVHKVVERMYVCMAELHDQTRPMSSFLFTGTTGVGKTELAKQIAKLLYDDTRRLIRFDMSEYSTSESVQSFRERLCEHIWARPSSVLLLDEIEKAHTTVSRLLLQVLDDGRLSDRNGREITFKNTYIIITTNEGSHIYNEINKYRDQSSIDSIDIYDEYKTLIISALTGRDSSFPSELLGRLDVIVPFEPLSLETQKSIAQRLLFSLAKSVRLAHGATLIYGNPRSKQEYIAMSHEYANLLVDDFVHVDANMGGARELSRLVREHITNKVAEFITKNPKCKTIYVTQRGESSSRNDSVVKSSVRFDVTDKPI